MEPVVQPANKPTSPFHSVGPLAWDQVMPRNKELLSCITSPLRGHPGCGLLSPGAASLQPPPHRPLSHYITIILPLCPGRGVSSFRRCTHEYMPFIWPQRRGRHLIIAGFLTGLYDVYHRYSYILFESLEKQLFSTDCLQTVASTQHGLIAGTHSIFFYSILH